MQREVRKENTWYQAWPGIQKTEFVNSSKHHTMALGSTEHQFSFTTKDSLDLPGMTIDSQLNFVKQVSLICKKKKGYNQLNVMQYRMQTLR